MDLNSVGVEKLNKHLAAVENSSLHKVKGPLKTWPTSSVEVAIQQIILITYLLCRIFNTISKKAPLQIIRFPIMGTLILNRSKNNPHIECII